MNKALTWLGPLALAGCLGTVLGVGIKLVAARSHAFDLSQAAGGGLVLGLLAALLQRHPRRALGLIPFGATWLLIGFSGLCWGFGPTWCVACFYFGVPLVALPGRVQFVLAWGTRDMFALLGVLAAGLIALFLGTRAVEPGTWQPPLWAVAASGVGVLLAFALYYRELVEQTTEVLLWPIYRIKAYGPGLATFPKRGPVLVVSNHTAWFDPIWLGKVIPRRIVPMMTSLFFDLPVMRFLMVYLIGAIRVQESGFRREVPELDEAIAALDRGECVILFPEGRVRRKEEEPLRPFGQGVWHILKQRPQTPVVLCWIEGGWGSYFSYVNGPPMKNKPMDRWHRIAIGLRDPEILPAELLAEHRATRTYLRNACLETRRFLGLESHEAGAHADHEDE